MHGRPQAWARGALAPFPCQEGALAPFPLWKCCKVFVCISTYSKTLSRRIIHAIFSQPVIGFWTTGAPPTPTRWGTFVPRPLICPPLEKILRAPMARKIDWCFWAKTSAHATYESKNRRQRHYVLRSSVRPLSVIRCPSVNTYFAWRHISLLSGRILTKLATNIQHLIWVGISGVTKVGVTRCGNWWCQCHPFHLTKGWPFLAIIVKSDERFGRRSSPLAPSPPFHLMVWFIR